MKKIFLALLVSGLLLSGCTDLFSGEPGQAPTPEPTASVTPSATPAPEPTATPALKQTPIQTPTVTSTPLATPAPELTPIPSPAAEPTPTPEPECDAGWKCRDEDHKAYQDPDCTWKNETECSHGCTGGECNSPISSEPVELVSGENTVYLGDLIVGLEGAGEFEGESMSLEVKSFWSETEAEFILFDSGENEIGRKVMAKGEFLNEKFFDSNNEPALASELELTDLTVKLVTQEGKITLTLFN